MNADRSYWLGILERLARPVLTNLSQGTLGLNLPVEGSRAPYAKLEMTGRLLAGIAPWLEVRAEGNEDQLRLELADLARKALAVGCDPKSPDFFNFKEEGGQPLVDAAYLGQAILRSPTELWEKLEPEVQTNLIEGLKMTRLIRPVFSNWLMFSAMVEASLYKMGASCDQTRVDYALRQHEQWYVGDSMYRDGPEFHVDYYTSFVMLPMLVDVTEAFIPVRPEFGKILPLILRRAQRQAAIQERLISPDGTFPPLGRSIVYRFGAFHVLAQMALRDELPPELKPAQVRSALTAVIKRSMAPGTFDQNGWLTIGLCGEQPSLGETYISKASTYLCAVGLLPLGLAASHVFWSKPAEPFTAQKIWGGERDVAIDKALLEEPLPPW